MPRDLIPTNRITRRGLSAGATLGSANGGQFQNLGRTVLRVTNTSDAAVTLTVPTIWSVGPLAVEDLVVSVPAGATRLIGPFPQWLFNQRGANASYVYIDYEAGNEAALELAALSLERAPVLLNIFDVALYDVAVYA